MVHILSSWGSLPPGLIQEQAVGEILLSNEYSEQFGLQLTRTQALELVETRTRALRSSGRVEFGSGIVGKLASAFCSSPFLSQDTYAETLHDLVELFYTYKSETWECISDDGLIGYMRSRFDEPCHGSLELLGGRELYRLVRQLRIGLEEVAEDE